MYNMVSVRYMRQRKERLRRRAMLGVAARLRNVEARAENAEEAGTIEFRGRMFGGGRPHVVRLLDAGDGRRVYVVCDDKLLRVRSVRGVVGMIAARILGKSNP
jgi:hypothetical protein